MRISDWSSDVCSSDLSDVRIDARRACPPGAAERTMEGKARGRRVGAIGTFIGGRFPGWVWLSVAVPGRGRRRGRRGDRGGCARPAGSVRAAGRAGAPFLAPVLVGVFVPPADRRNRATQRAKRSEEHTSELQSLMRISYAVFCLKKKKTRD